MSHSYARMWSNRARSNAARVAITTAAGALTLAAAAGPAAATPLPHETFTSLGRPPVRVRLRVESRPDGVELAVRAGTHRAKVALPVPEASEVSVETVRLAGGARVATVRVSGAAGNAAALVTSRGGEPVVLWTGRLDPHGDPGEQRADSIEIADRTGDDVPDVIVGVILESNHICGQDRTVLFPRAVDPRTLELRPVVLRRLPAEAPTIEVQAVRESPGPEGPPLLDALHFVAASSAASVERDPALVPAPQALDDGDPATLWMEGHGSGGRWEYVTALWNGGHRAIRAVAITVSPAREDLARQLGRPRTLWLVGDRGPRLRVTLPDEAGAPGTPWWVVPPEPLPWRCLSVVIDDVAAPSPGGAPSVHTALADVAAYTDLDFGAGLEALVAELESDGEAAPEAVQLLSRLGPEAARSVAERWPRLSDVGRRRAVQVLAAHAASSAEAREALLGAAGEAADPGTGEAAVAALAAAGEAAAAELGTLAREPGELGDQAALELSRLGPGLALPALLGALDTPRGTERPALRRALRRAARELPPEAGEVLAGWSSGPPTVASAAAGALALAGTPAGEPTAMRLVRETAPRAEEFADRWRLVAAAGRLPSDGAVDRWLAQLATGDEPWMLRAAAVRALAQRGVEAAAPAARAAVEDSYPRVRLAAVEALAGRPDDLERVAVRARRDRWPLVRAEAVRALTGQARALPVVRAAIGDHAARVRAAAVEVLAEAGDRSAWPAVRRRLEDDDEWPEVLAASVRYAQQLCVAEASGPLGGLVDRAMRPDGWAPDLDVAVEAVGALVALGGTQAQQVLARAASPTAPGALRTAVARAREAVRRCGGAP